MESNAHRVIFSASTVAYMTGTIVAKLVTNVRMSAHSVRMISSLVDHRTFYALLYLLSTEQTYSAGHPGDHMYVRNTIGVSGFLSACSCVVNAHLCGERCSLSGKRGCLDDCTKVGHCGFA